MIMKARALRAIVGVHLFCAVPLVAIACGGEQPESAGAGGPNQDTGGAQAGTGAGTGGSPPAAGGTAPAAGGTNSAGGGTSDAGGTSSGGASAGGSSGGDANAGGSSAGSSAGGDANAGSGGGVDPGTGGKGSDSIDGPMAYGITIAPNGTWMGIKDPATEIAAIEASGAKYVRFSRAMNLQQVGIPNAENAQHANQLIDAGIKLGCVLISQDGPPAADLIEMGKKLKDSGYYDWIFVDGALTRTDIQDIIDGLHDVGWEKIMVNDTGFPNGERVVTDPPKRVLGHAKAFGAVNNPDGPAITENDQKFIDWIHENRPDGVPILKLEIDSGIQKFLALPLATQKRLLKDWEAAQPVNDFKMIYPLFTTTYDSMAVGTYDTQVDLLK